MNYSVNGDRDDWIIDMKKILSFLILLLFITIFFELLFFLNISNQKDTRTAKKFNTDVSPTPSDIVAGSELVDRFIGTGIQRINSELVQSVEVKSTIKGKVVWIKNSVGNKNEKHPFAMTLEAEGTNKKNTMFYTQNELKLLKISDIKTKKPMNLDEITLGDSLEVVLTLDLTKPFDESIIMSEIGLVSKKQ